jgi:hypothetical protein
MGAKARAEFTAEIRLDEVERPDKKIVRNALNAGATMEAVQRANNNHYFISRDFYKTLARIRAHFLVAAAPHALAIAASGGGARAPAGRLRAATPAALAAGTHDSAEPRLLQRLAAATPLRGPSEAIREQIWGELLGAMGLTPASAGRLEHAPVREEAAAACRALDQLAETNPRLGHFLRELNDGKREALRQKLGELREHFAADTKRAKLLEEAAAELTARFKALLLLPEAGILQDLIERLEEPAQVDDGQAPGEQELLGLLRAVQGEIKRIDKSRPEAWKTVLDMIRDRRSEAPSHTIRELDPANKQPI